MLFNSSNPKPLLNRYLKISPPQSNSQYSTPLTTQTPNQPGNLLIQPIHHTHNLSEIPNRGVTYS